MTEIISHSADHLLHRSHPCDSGRPLRRGAFQETISAVRKAAQGEAVLHSRVASRVIQQVRTAKRAVPAPFTQLTGRELDVLLLIAEGQSNAAIAEKLVLSEKTIKGAYHQYSQQAADGGSHAGGGLRLAARAYERGLSRDVQRVRETFRLVGICTLHPFSSRKEKEPPFLIFVVHRAFWRQYIISGTI